MSSVIVDTSLAVKWVIAEDDSDRAEQLRHDWQARRVDVLAPSWFACELANVIYQHVRDGPLTYEDAVVAMVTVLAHVRLLDVEPISALRGLEIAAILRQKASYNSQYLALAEHFGCELWTADRQFWRVARAGFPQVRWIGEVAHLGAPPPIPNP